MASKTYASNRNPLDHHFGSFRKDWGDDEGGRTNMLTRRSFFVLAGAVPLLFLSGCGESESTQGVQQERHSGVSLAEAQAAPTWKSIYVKNGERFFNIVDSKQESISGVYGTYSMDRQTVAFYCNLDMSNVPVIKRGTDDELVTTCSTFSKVERVYQLSETPSGYSAYLEGNICKGEWLVVGGEEVTEENNEWHLCEDMGITLYRNDESAHLFSPEKKSVSIEYLSGDSTMVKQRNIRLDTPYWELEMNSEGSDVHQVLKVERSTEGYFLVDTSFLSPGCYLVLPRNDYWEATRPDDESVSFLEASGLFCIEGA